MTEHVDDVGVDESVDGGFWVLWTRTGAVVSITAVAKDRGRES